MKFLWWIKSTCWGSSPWTAQQEADWQEYGDFSPWEVGR